jgi:sensor histidine kinase YesM
MGAVSLLCTAITSFFPFIFFNPYYYIIIQAVTLPFDIILLSYLTESVARKVPYAKLYTIGYIALISGIMVDCFYTNGLIPYISSLFMPITFFLFIITFISIFFDKITAIYRASVKAAELDKELVTANTAIMISQIQPHFLYNALNTIKYLIKRDPKTAEKAVISFSKYLRGNMDSITQKSPIPFAEELEHIKNYCDIELLRFEEKLEIVYNTDFVDFKVPSLTIQPLVENAIKHGVTKRPEGGTVTITTEETDNFYTVVIEDNGIGFDAENPDYTPNDNHAHVGLKNVKNRLEMMVNAEVVVQSELDVGTTITINIPKGEKL